jgi:hypothetical protein
LAAILSLPWLVGLTWPGPLGAVLAGGDRHANSLTDAATAWVGDHVLLIVSPTARAAHALANQSLNLIARAAFVVYFLYEVARVLRRSGAGTLDMRDVVRASAGVVLAGLLLLLTQVGAWYYALPVALVSLLGWRSVLAKFTIALSLTFLPVFYLRHYAMGLGSDGLLAAYVAVPLLIPLVPWTTRVVRRRFVN